MTPKIFSTLVLRLFAVWFLVEGLLSAVDVVSIHQDLMGGLQGVHRRWYLSPTPSTPLGGENMSLHDAYFVVAHSNPALIPTTLRLVGGLILWFSSKPMSRFLTHDLEHPDPEKK